ncbi:MAG TPA: hypothetical protein VFR38_03905 [Gaiellaceae bacterium]|nr:hypothetical protein [Gaiellaceae bacterium]
MLWGERVTRRRVLLGIIVVFGLVDAAFAFTVLGTDDGRTMSQAVPLHPLVGTFIPDDTRVEECGDASCFQQALGNISFREGPKQAFAAVDVVYGEADSPACHRATHFIGAASFVRYGGSVSRALAEGSPKCWSGYYHGVLERTFVRVKSYKPSALAAAARSLCREAARTMTPWTAYQCIHGLGHGLMISTGLNLPLSLAVCRRLDRRWDRDACKGGVFMENLSASYGVHSRWLRDDDPLYPCDAVARGDKRRCYLMVTSRILPLVGDDWQRTADTCARVESDFIAACFRSYGRDASSRNGRNASESANTCAIARPYGGEGWCIVGASHDIAGNYASGLRALPLCERVAANLRRDCFFGLGAVMGRLRRATAARIADCRALVTEPRLVDACLRGGRSALPRG